MKSKIKKFLLNLILLIFFTILFLSGFIYIRIRISLPVRSGEINLKGVKDKIFIYFNEYGIPHIETKYLDDVFFAIGYLHAQDRMFQMDLLRRVSFGELSEIFGEKTFKVDSFFRVLGIKRISIKSAKNLLPLEKRILESYLKGVNAYIEKRKGMLPIEFLLLNYKPKKWEIEHSIAIGKLISWNLNLSFKGDLFYTELKEKIDTEKIKVFLPFYPLDAPTHIESINEFEKKEELLKKVEKFIPSFTGSNAIAVSNPAILENDPHLDLTIPSNWYLISVKSDSLNFVGFTVPGIPLPVPGTNWKIAVGVTSLCLDDGDFIKGDLQNVDIIEETIKIKGNNDKKIKVILKDEMPLVDEKNKLFYFWRSSLLSHEILSIFKLYRANNVYEADSALKDFRDPSLNFLICDVQGNLLYKACGWIEKREKPSIFVREEKPEEFIPDSLLPKKINPENGYIASCNNPPERNYKYYISLYFSPSGRARRVKEILKNKKEFNYKDLMNLSKDVKDAHAELIGKKILLILKNIPMDQREKDLYEKLNNFDYNFTKDKEEPLIFYKLIYKIFENFYKEKLGEKLYKKFLSFSYIPLSVLENNIREGVIEDYYIIKSFRELCKEYKKEKYGKYHIADFKHPFKEIKFIGFLFKLKEISLDGGLTTINKMGFELQSPYKVTEGPSMRMIIDLKNKNFYYILPPGESGVIFDRNYSNQYELWAKGEYLTLFPFNITSKLIISP